MAIFITGQLGKVVGTVFTTLIAPVLVNVIVAALHDGKGDTEAAASVHPPIDERDVVIAHGSGLTRDEATRTAVRSALLRTIAVVADDCPPAVAETVSRPILHEVPNAVVLRCQVVASAQERQHGRLVFRDDVAVEIARRCLIVRLQAAHVRVHVE